MSETMLNCDMPCSETQNASALARPGKLWESQVDHAFLTESPSLQLATPWGPQVEREENGKNQVPFHVLAKNTQY